MIVTLMCANLIIGNIYVTGTPSVKVVQYHHDSGSVFPCRWITLSGIYKRDRRRNKLKFLVFKVMLQKPCKIKGLEDIEL